MPVDRKKPRKAPKSLRMVPIMKKHMVGHAIVDKFVEALRDRRISVHFNQ